jgi:hypothetical protein
MVVGSDEQLAGRRGKIGGCAQEINRAGISQVEVKPERPARLLDDRMIDRELLGRSVSFTLGDTEPRCRRRLYRGALQGHRYPPGGLPGN